MKDKTNLIAVKEILKMFLHMPVCETTMFPFFVQHPMFETGEIYVNGEKVDITQPEGFNQAAKNIEKSIDEMQDIRRCIGVLRQPYCLSFLKDSKKHLSLHDFSILLRQCWTKEENPNGDVNVPPSLAAKWFCEADKEALMSKEEYAIFNALPESFAVYRGVSYGRNPKGMSWMRDRKKAEWYANRLGIGYVIQGIAEKKDVLAFFLYKDEEEVVIASKNVKEKEKLSQKIFSSKKK